MEAENPHIADASVSNFKRGIFAMQCHSTLPRSRSFIHIDHEGSLRSVDLLRLREPCPKLHLHGCCRPASSIEANMENFLALASEVAGKTDTQQRSNCTSWSLDNGVHIISAIVGYNRQPVTMYGD